MALVSRACAGRQNKNRLRFHRVKVYAQRFPGKIGTDEERAVSDTPAFHSTLDGHSAQSGRLASDGSIELCVPGEAKAVLNLLGTAYEIEVLLDIEPHDSLLGAQRRLNLLGYCETKADNKYGARTDAAALDFQADTGLDPDGRLLEAPTLNKLKSEFGE